MRRPRLDVCTATTDKPPRPLSVAAHRALVAALALLAAAALMRPALAAHPFYEQLLQRGTDDFNRRDYDKAVHRLRLACFGLLDEPELLAEGLTRLALAQAGNGDEEGFRETFQRLAEVEDRFGAYTAAAIPGDMRKGLEQFVGRLVPRATLSASASFSRLVPIPEDPLFKLPPAKRRKQLERRIEEQPDDVRWRLALAELDLGEGNLDAAWAQADGALSREPGNMAARRVRGRVLAAQGRWAAAAQELGATEAAGSDPAAAEALLLALVKLERWSDAVALWARLPDAVRQKPRVAELGRITLEAAQGQMAPTPTRPR